MVVRSRSPPPSLLERPTLAHNPERSQSRNCSQPFNTMGDEEPVEPKKKILIQDVSGYIGGNLAKRFQAEGFEVLAPSRPDPKPLAVERIIEPTAETLSAAFLESEMTVLDLLGDIEGAESMLSAITAAVPWSRPRSWLECRL